MATFTMNQINSIYSGIISDYLNNGYSISTSTASGSYSDEICHIDLTPKRKSNELIRVWMIRGREDLGRDYWYVDVIKISVHKYDLNDNSIYWYSDGTRVGNETKFYEIRSKQAYTDSIDECRLIAKLRKSRWECKSNSTRKEKILDVNNVPKSVKDSIINKIRQVDGAKRAKNYDCIKRISLKKSDSSNKNLYVEAYWEFNNKHGYVYFGR